MPVIAVTNPKGGSGKSTITFNLGIFLKQLDYQVFMFDLDETSSLTDLVKTRPKTLPKLFVSHITFDDIGSNIKKLTDLSKDNVILMDLPARLTAEQLEIIVTYTDIIITPTLPSAIDARVLVQYIFSIMKVGSDRIDEIDLAMVANRAKFNTKSYKKLTNDLSLLHYPYVGGLRDTQNYVLSAAQGIGIAEFPKRLTKKDIEHWKPILEWVENNLKSRLIDNP